MAIAEQPQTTRPRDITVLGSTGSIGCSTLDLISRDRHAFNVIALTAFRNVDFPTFVWPSTPTKPDLNDLTNQRLRCRETLDHIAHENGLAVQD